MNERMLELEKKNIMFALKVDVLEEAISTARDLLLKVANPPFMVSRDTAETPTYTPPFDYTTPPMIDYTTSLMIDYTTSPMIG